MSLGARGLERCFRSKVGGFMHMRVIGGGRQGRGCQWEWGAPREANTQKDASCTSWWMLLRSCMSVNIDVLEQDMVLNRV